MKKLSKFLHIVILFCNALFGSFKQELQRIYIPKGTSIAINIYKNISSQVTKYKTANNISIKHTKQRHDNLHPASGSIIGIKIMIFHFLLLQIFGFGLSYL